MRPYGRVMRPSQLRVLAGINADLARLIRYDDESLVHEVWIRQRYDCGCYQAYGPARSASVRTAWHEAGHAVAAIATGSRFSSASIHHGAGSEGRVHRIKAATDTSFVIDAAGQIAERLMTWTVLGEDDELRCWLATWRADGGDARRFRRAIADRFPGDEVSAWRYSEAVLVPLRQKIRHLARALVLHPRYLPYPVVKALVDAVG
jgi:hypothetical protein